MKNLKKVLSLVLALAMALSLMTVAFAKDANVGGYADSDKITHNEAVSVLSALNVINGKDNNLFDPAGTVTRAEMAKMITVIALGDVDVSAFKGTKTDLKDATGWSEAYVKYCYSQGIISGRGNGIFDPNANVTASEAAKMLLVAIGYNAKVQGYEGANWAINVTRDAQLSGFYKDLSVSSTKALSRDEAAQMIYNAVDTNTIIKTSSVDRVTGAITDTYAPNGKDLLEKTFNVVRTEGVLSCAANDYDSDKGKFEYTITGTSAPTFKSTTDYTDLYMQNVEVLSKTENGKTTVYGIYAKDSTVVASGVMGDITAPAADATKVKIDSTEYKLTGRADATPIYEFLTGAVSSTNLDDTATYATATNKKIAYEFKLIDNTGDGKGDVVVVYPFTVAKVTYVGTKSFTADSSYKFEDVDSYKGLAKDDFVKITAAANTSTNTALFEKVEQVSAKAQAVKKTDGKVQFNNTWYSTAITSAKSPAQTTTAGADCKYVAVNGYLFDLDSDATVLGINDYVIVTKAADKTAGMDNTISAQILKADGTKATIEVAKVGDTAASDSNKPAVGTLYTYKVNDDGYYELTAASTTASATDFDAVAGSSITYTAATSKKDGFVTYDTDNKKAYIAADAVVFVKESATKYSVTTGAKLKDTNSAVTVKYIGVKNDSNSGYGYVKLAYVESGSLGETTNKYAYVSGDVVKYQDTSDSNKYYVEIPVGNGDKLVTKSTAAAANDVVDKAYKLAKGEAFTYQLTSDGKVESITKYTMAALADTSGAKDFTAAIVAVEGKDIRFSNDYFKNAAGAKEAADKLYDATLTDDTVIIYVDSSDNSVAEGGSIQKASSNIINSNTSNYANAKAVTNASNEVLLLIVDVNNDILDLQ